MHEASLVLGMVPVIEKNMIANSGSYISKVVVRIGKLSGVERYSFEFAFDAIKREHEWLKDADLVINEVPGNYHCHDCGHEFTVDHFDFPLCEKCQSPAVEMTSGDELLLESLEIDKGD